MQGWPIRSCGCRRGRNHFNGWRRRYSMFLPAWRAPLERSRSCSSIRVSVRTVKSMLWCVVGLAVRSWWLGSIRVLDLGEGRWSGWSGTSARRVPRAHGSCVRYPSRTHSGRISEPSVETWRPASAGDVDRCQADSAGNSRRTRRKPCSPSPNLEEPLRVRTLRGRLGLVPNPPTVAELWGRLSLPALHLEAQVKRSPAADIRRGASRRFPVPPSPSRLTLTRKHIDRMQK